MIPTQGRGPTAGSVRPSARSNGGAARISFAPDALEEMGRGVRTMVDAVRPTLGPLPRLVAIDRRPLRDGAPEVVDHGATIGQRIVELWVQGDRTGAAIVRDVMLEVDREVGDGTTTAALLFEAMYSGGVRAIASGHEPNALRTSIAAAADVAAGVLETLSTPVERDDLDRLVLGQSGGDRDLAATLAAALKLAGPDGRIDFRKGQASNCSHEVIPGYYWRGGAPSRSSLPPTGSTVLADCDILVTDFDVDDPDGLRELLDRLAPAGRPVLLIASTFSPACVAICAQERRLVVVPSKAPEGSDIGRLGEVKDIAMLVGAEPLFKAAGASLAGATTGSLGRARRIRVDANFTTVIGGGGSPVAVRDALRELSAATPTDAAARLRRSDRIARLRGGAVIVHVGGNRDQEIEARKAAATRALRASRVALLSGVVPGGGDALLACRPALRMSLERSDTATQRAAFDILVRACEAPAAQLRANAGSAARTMGAPSAGPTDPLAVVRTALLVAAGAAGLAFTTAAVVRGGRAT